MLVNDLRNMSVEIETLMINSPGFQFWEDDPSVTIEEGDNWKRTLTRVQRIEPNCGVTIAYIDVTLEGVISKRVAHAFVRFRVMIASVPEFGEVVKTLRPVAYVLDDDVRYHESVCTALDRVTKEVTDGQ